jgi:hypothetical protein
LNGLFAVRAQIAKLRSARPGETEEGHGHGNGHIDADLPQTMAMGNIHKGIIAGKLNGEIPAQTPMG